MQDPWTRNYPVTVHGMAYSPGIGWLRSPDFDVSSPGAIETNYHEALSGIWHHHR
ncbi:carbonic anhydrase [Paraburkholderia caledonica]|uniref:Uncharacterized protein n=1 Tax=Paraburkholderia caledonica TaxID=134536 RepID=A0AB73IPH9_9BURK|nr:hypothetical protein [Paraburkholderia caledonica]